MRKSPPAAPRRMEFDAVVEVPKGSRNKYEADHSGGQVRLTRVLFGAMRYPVDYGYIPDTLAGDGDPLDVLVVLDEPTFPGCVITCRPVALLRMRDQHGNDMKVLALPTFDIHRRWDDLRDVPEELRREIRHFFEVYKDLDPDGYTDVVGWSGRAAAEREILAARRRGARPGPR